MDIHLYEYDGESMPGTVNGYWEIYEGEYGDGTFLASADNANVFGIAMGFADAKGVNIIIHTLSYWYASEQYQGV